MTGFGAFVLTRVETRGHVALMAPSGHRETAERTVCSCAPGTSVTRTVA